MNADKKRTLDNLMSSMSADDLRAFVKSYSLSNPSFLRSLEEYFEGMAEKPSTFDYENEVKQCYIHYYKAPMWEHDWSHYPQYLDWDLVGKDLRKVIRKAHSAIDAGHPELAVETAFLILDIDGRMYEEDFLCEREDWSAEDLCLDDCFELIEKAIASPLMTKEQRLEICRRAQESYKSELIDFVGYDIDKMIEETRSALLTEDELLEVKMHEFDAERGWRMSSMACDIWDYLFEIGRPETAESFFRENRNLDKLRERYVAYKLGNGSYAEAMTAIDEGLSLAQKQKQFGTVRKWREQKLSLLEKMGNPLASSVCLDLFADSYGDKAVEYYRRAKRLVAPEEWADYRSKLLSMNEDLKYSADSALADIYCEEGLVDCLYSHLINSKSHLLDALSRFARLFSPEQQAALVNTVKKEFPIALGYNPNRKSYVQIAGQISQIARTCPAGKKLAVEMLDGFRSKYPNRPALLEELAKVKL